MHIPNRVMLFLCFIFYLTVGYGQNYVVVRPNAGEGIESLLDRYQLLHFECAKESFCTLNHIQANDLLFTHRSYTLPIIAYTYNGKSIRSTIGNPDWDLAVQIASYNETLRQTGIKSSSYKKDKDLWVPSHFVNCERTNPKVVQASKTMIHVPLFGDNHHQFPKISNQLSQKVYYLVSGHGGPDPGAIGSLAGASLCEDEYAYDVTLRLAKNLMAHGAEVHVIVQDLNDGIREGEILPCDQEERCIENEEIPLNQLKRLQQRADKINSLYIQNHSSDKEQIAVMIHVDSRSKHKKKDVFFYHLKDSKQGQSLANNLYQTFRSKYKQHRSSGRYYGFVNSRNLYMLRATYPPAVFIELGNIKNPNDQKRIILKGNRQALANWIFEGITGFPPS